MRVVPLFLAKSVVMPKAASKAPAINDPFHIFKISIVQKILALDIL
jgi:hypothetical protein